MAATSLGRIMSNIRGPSTTSRKMLGSVVNSMILYGAPVWEKTLNIRKYRNILEKVQRKILIRICRAYRTAATKALQVIAGIPPIDLMIKERTRIYNGGREVIEIAREEVEEQWQSRWESTEEGSQWTKKLIPNIRSWKNRKHGEVDFYTAQVLTGHGCFNSYLSRIQKRETKECTYCGAEDDTAEHTVFQCTRWVEQRRRINLKIEEDLTTNNMITLMVGKEEHWREICKYIQEILKIKEIDERR